MIAPLRYRALKWLPWARWCSDDAARRWRMFERMLGEFPGDAYALASRAHLHGAGR